MSTRHQTSSCQVPERFRRGETFVKWDDEYGGGTAVTLRIDKQGFFLYWTDSNKEVDMLDISTIRDSRTGKLSKIPKEVKLRQAVSLGSQDEPLEDKTVTLALGQDFVSLTFVNFCCSSRDTAQDWTEQILRLAYNPLQVNCSLQTTLAKLHSRLSLSHVNIQVKNIVKYLAQNKEDRKRIKTALELSGLPCGKDDVIPPEKFTFDDFFAFYKNLTQRTDIEKIFNEYCEGNKGMTSSQVVEFLNKCQRDPRLNEILHPYADEARAALLIKQYEPDEKLAADNKLSLEGFTKYLVSEESQVVFPTKQDMDQPMSCYFINSSHNTYLTGHQLTGKSSVEMYRQCLLAGCRCVELDLWNGSNKSEEPTVVHGYTLVPDLQAKDVIQTIAQSAFITSDYPVILSFENHCNPRQQAKIANYCREFFGDTLLDKALDSYPLDSGFSLPPPSQLKRKIIIKNKKRSMAPERSPGEVRSAQGEEEDPPPTPSETNGFPLKEEIERAQSHTDSAQDSASPVTKSAVEEEVINTTSVKLSEQESSTQIDTPTDTTKEDTTGEPVKEELPKPEVKEQEEESKTKETEAGAEISALVNYVQPVHFVSFEESEKKDRSFEMSSFDEKQATSLLKESPIEFVNYNKRQLSRVYPAGTRFDSSNFMPQVFWNAGCQLVALNYQTLDLAMQLNLGIFEYNCRSGYLLKPEFMRRTDRRFDPFAESTVDGIIAGTVVVHVISGQLLSDKRCGTYVEVDMFGLPADTVRKKFKTKVVPNNAINPVYDEEPFVFKKVVLPELACLRISAYEDNGRFIGHRILPLQALCPGYRHVALRSESGQALGAATLFLHIIVKDYVPDGLTELAEALANPIKYQSELDRREKQLAVLTEGMDIQEDGEDDVGTMRSPVERSSVLKREVSRISCERGAGVTGSVEAEGIVVTVAGLEAFMEAEGAITAQQLHADRQPVVQQARLDVSHISDLAQQMHADTLDKFLNSKPVLDKKLELEKKLDALRKKQEKERERAEDPDRSMTNCLPKINRLTDNKALSGGEELARIHLAQEQALKEKYHALIFNMLSKAVTTRQAAQLKELTSALEKETASVMRRLQAQRSKELRRLSKQHRHKDELNRMKREVGSAMVERGVEERVRLRALYERQREQLEQQHTNVRTLLQQETAKAKAVLEKELEERLPRGEDKEVVVNNKVEQDNGDAAT